MRKFSKKDFAGCVEFSNFIPKMIDGPTNQDRIDFMYVLKNSEFVLPMKTEEEPFYDNIQGKNYLFLFSDHKTYKSTGKNPMWDFKSITLGLTGGFDDIVHLSEKYEIEGFIYDVDGQNFLLSKENILSFRDDIHKRETEPPIELKSIKIDELGEEFKNNMIHVMENELDEVISESYLIMSADKKNEEILLHLFVYLGDVDISPGKFKSELFFSELIDSIQSNVNIPFAMRFYVLGSNESDPYIELINSMDPFFIRTDK